MTVTSAADAARVRAERAAAGPLMSRSQRNADREKRGEADHSLAGLLLYALSTVRSRTQTFGVKHLLHTNFQL